MGLLQARAHMDLVPRDHCLPEVAMSYEEGPEVDPLVEVAE